MGDNSKAKRSSISKHSIYRGMRMRSRGKWVSEIREPRKKSRIWLGTFATLEMAVRAHDVTTLSIKGEFTILNFPHLVILLPQPVSLMPHDIQVVVAKAIFRVEIPSVLNINSYNNPTILQWTQALTRNSRFMSLLHASHLLLLNQS
ncbi:hypothetical protein Gotri_021120 [Gossypium trilobum]|uniref:AP2/ERF domain-containing protein n=1 Tax=Gossypium trilobum TaxID=34281 RepID=A0A7J9DBG0_9ROSI|nr:hypothetical protein [Gossypium trilobum]